VRRRDFITWLAGAAAFPISAWGQPATLPVIGFLGTGSPDPFKDRVDAFRQGLSEFGFVEGVNVGVEYRWAEDRRDRLPALAADLIRRRVAVIATMSGAATLAVKAATATIPIVFYIGGDPIKLGLVSNLHRPGGNLTGVNNLSGEVGPKRLELLHELVPAIRSVAILINPATADTSQQLKDLERAATNLKTPLHVLKASSERDFDAVFASLNRQQIGALVIAGDLFFTSRSQQLAALALQHKIPAVFQFREFAAAGGLMSYGGSFTDMYRLVGVYAGRILKGEKPADLPVQQATKAELIINLKTAKALGLTVPLPLLGRADEVIE
jgi:putative ABC transport system substrate-binding protein